MLDAGYEMTQVATLGLTQMRLFREGRRERREIGESLRPLRSQR